MYYKKKKINVCECPIRKNSIFTDTYKELYKNTNNENVDILILLEHKEIKSKSDIFNHLCYLYFKNYSYAIIPALGCTPKNFFSNDTILTYQKCKKFHIDKIIKKLKPKVILTVGRSLYTITESKDLIPKHFYIPVNDSIQDFHLDDCKLYSSQYNCNVYPIPPLYHWINEMTKDVYEYKFSLEQFKRVIKEINIPLRRIQKFKFEFIKDTSKLLKTFIDDKKIKEISIDTESSGLNYFTDELYSIQFSINNNSSYFCYWKDINKELLIELFNRKDIIFIFHNAQHDIKFLISNGINNARCDFDTMLASHMLNENSSNGLKSLTWIYTYHGGYDFDVKEFIKKYKIKDFTQIPESILLDYACYDSVLTFILYEYFCERFEKENKFLKENFYNHIMPAVEMIIDVEMTGILIDMNYLKEYVNNLKNKAKEIEKEMYSIAKKRFNINSNKQLTKIFYLIPNFQPLTDERGKILLTKNNDLILDKETLERYANEMNIPFAKIIIEYNHIIKEISQFGYNIKKGDIKRRNKLFKFEENNNEDETNGKGYLASIYKNRLYGGYKIHGTNTGRMSGGGGLDSSWNPQNQPTTIEFRKIFLPTLGYVFGRSDFDAMEMCIISQLAGPGPMEDVILSGKDPHCFLAVNLAELQGIKTTYEEIYEKSLVEGKIEKKFKDLRTNSKIFNFQLIYGATKYGLANTFNISIELAEKFLKVYSETYPEIMNYIEKYRNHAQKFGWVKTLLGRKRRLPQLTYIGKDSYYNKDSYFNVGKLLNAAINAPDQGTSGQTTVIAMINIRKEFKKRNMKSRIIINVHDEIVFELKIEEIEEAEKIIKYFMEFPYYKNEGDNKVKLTADLEYGEIWKYGHNKEYWKQHPEEWDECLENIKNRNEKLLIESF